MEAYARACDEASIPPFVPRNEDDEDDDNSREHDMTQEERASLPLHVKIENTIPYLLQNCTSKSFMERFEHPKKHPVVGLFILPNKKFF